MNTVTPTAPDVGVVLLAAGRSARMGRPKLLLPWGNRSVLGHHLHTWQSLGVGQIAIVCAAGDAAIAAELDRLSFPPEARIFNPAPERGMLGSLRCAAAWPNWAPELTRLAVVLGDQPHPRRDTLQALLAFSARHPTTVCQPRLDGALWHPVILPKAIFQQLSETRATSLREFLEALPDAVAACDLEDPGLKLDLDTPADYAQALRKNFPPT
jgi:molybdenum cofactor cytidylyltransferase